MAQECNYEVGGVYDICGARVASETRLVKSGCSAWSEIWGLGPAFTKCTVPDIPYTPVPEWFRKNPGLVDEPGTPILDGRTPKKPRHRKRPANDVEMAIEEAFEHMDESMEANIEVNNLINEVVNEVVNEANLGGRGADSMESILEDMRRQHAEEIHRYKARIFYLENQVATLTMGRLAVQVVHQLHQQFSLWKQRGTQFYRRPRLQSHKLWKYA